MLIEINPKLIVDSSIIEKAYRNGNYTDITLRGRSSSTPESIWDPNEEVWSRIRKASNE